MNQLGRNDIRIRDPFVFCKDDLYYLYGSTDRNTWSGKGSGFMMYRSKDLETFEGPFEVFHAEENFWGEENFWAPEVYEYKECYYMSASFKGNGRRGVQLLCARSPEGPFLPIKNAAITPKEWDCLDGTLYWEDNQCFLIFCHEWTQVIDGEICIARLSEDMMNLEGEPVVLFRVLRQNGQ
ncbi:MAG: hypothetical protein PWP24_277 [Clostridiales bacterium]|nr:hypothetical protein [Clostridiales bacterium]